MKIQQLILKVPQLVLWFLLPVGLVILSAATQGCKEDNNVSPGETVQPPINSIKHYIDQIRPDFKIGVFFNELPSNNEPHLKFITDNFNAVTLGIYMKGTQSRAGEYDFTNLNARLAFAMNNDMWVKFHPAFGHDTYNSDWLINDELSEEQLINVMDERLDTIMTLYNEKINAIDVVNEAVPWDEKGEIWQMDNNVWLKLGMSQDGDDTWPVFIEKAFVLSKQYAGPGVELILNENNNSMTNSLRTDNFLEAVRILQENNVPIDGVGMQLHFGVIDGVVKESTRGVGAVLDTASMREVIKIYGDMGLDVHISEFDVHLPQNPSESDFQIQADAYKAILKVALESPNCKSFITWGTADEKGWKPDGYNPHSLWLGEGFKPKENYFAVLEMLQEMAEDK